MAKRHTITFVIDDKGMMALGSQGDFSPPELVYALEVTKAKLLANMTSRSSFDAGPVVRRP